MIPEKVIYTLLNAAAGVTALAGTRIYSDTRPEGDALPAIVTALISDFPELHLTASAGINLWQARVQVSCFGLLPEDAKNLADAAMAACHLQSGSIAGVTVGSIVADRGPSDFDPLTFTYTQPVDFLLDYYR